MCGCGEREILRIVITITIFSQSIPFTGESSFAILVRMIWALAFIGLPTPEDSNCALLPPLALRRRSQSKKSRAAKGTDHPYARTKVGSSSAITNLLTALLVCFSVATPLPDHATPYLYEEPHFEQMRPSMNRSSMRRRCAPVMLTNGVKPWTKR
jgi:hypothetical protein